ncbi:MAG: PEP-CTERM sorting domain-containing protein [Planctomycetaceae bacterium]|nr:PEP-CTERM sorting domain-containing protein [Planctomycetaceae bacterium]
MRNAATTAPVLAMSFLIMCLVAVGPVLATDYTWNTGWTNNNWMDTAQWDPTPVDFSSGNLFYMNSGDRASANGGTFADQLTLYAGSELHLDGDQSATANNLVLDGGTFSGEYRTNLYGAINVASASILRANYNGYQFTINSELNGSGNIQKTGSGYLQLGSTSGNWSGTMTVDESYVEFTSNRSGLRNGTLNLGTAYGAGTLHLINGFNSGTVNVKAGGLAWLNGDESGDVTGGTLNLDGGEIRGEFRTNLYGPINVLSNSTLRANYGGYNFRVHTLNGTADINKTGDGYLELGGQGAGMGNVSTGDWSGTMTISQGYVTSVNRNSLGGGTIKVDGSGGYLEWGSGFNSGTINILSGGSARMSNNFSETNVSGATVNLNGGELFGQAATRIYGDINILGTASTMRANWDGYNFELMGSLHGEMGVAVTKTGDGRLVLYGDSSSTYSGMWDVAYRGLWLENNNALGSAMTSLTIENGGFVRYSGTTNALNVISLTLGGNTFDEGTYNIANTYLSNQGNLINFASYFNVDGGNAGTIYNGLYTMIWNAGADGNWSDSTWTNQPPTYPTANEKAQIDTAYKVTVDDAQAAKAVALSNGGQLYIAPTGTLTISGYLNATSDAGTKVIVDAGATLAAGKGAVNTMDLLGSATVAATTAGQDLAVAEFTASTAGTVLTKTGAGTLALANSGDANFLSNTTLELQGGLVKLTGETLHGATINPLNGGGLAINNPTAVDLTAQNFQVTANGGELQATTADVAFGSVTLADGAELRGSGAGKVSVTGTVLAGAGKSGTLNAVNTDLNMGAYSDGGAAQTLNIKGSGAGRVVMDNSAGGISAANSSIVVQSGTLTAIGTATHDATGGATTVQLAGGKLELSGVPTIGSVNNALTAGIYYNDGWNPDPQLLFEKPGNLLTQVAAETEEDTGKGISNGPGINYNGNFNLLFPGQTRTENFQVAWTGYYKAPETGNQCFNSYWGDDAYTMYIDVNQNGTFEENERISGNWGGPQWVNLTQNESYKVAFGFAENGGGENVGFQFWTSALGWQNINPSAANQAGMWSYIGMTYGEVSTSANLLVTASSTLEANSGTAVDVSAVTLRDGTLTIQGTAPQVNIGALSVDAAAGSQVGIGGAIPVSVTGALDGNSVATTIAKTGSGTLILNAAGVNLENTTIDVQRGTLVGNAAGAMGTAAIKLTGGYNGSYVGGSLVLNSPDGLATTYDNAVTVQHVNLGNGDYGHQTAAIMASGGAITLGSAGKTLTVEANYDNRLTLQALPGASLEIASDIAAGWNSRVGVYKGDVTFAGTGTQSFYHLGVNEDGSGNRNDAGNYGKLTVDGPLVISGEWLQVRQNGQLILNNSLDVGYANFENNGSLVRNGTGTAGDVTIRNQMNLGYGYTIDTSAATGTGSTFTANGANLYLNNGSTLKADNQIAASYMEVNGGAQVTGDAGFDVSGTLVLQGGTLTTSGTVNAQNLNLSSGTFNQNGQAISIKDGGTLTVGNGFNLNLTSGAALTMGSGASLNINGGGTVTTDQALHVYNLNMDGTLNLTGATPDDRNLQVDGRLYVGGADLNMTGSNLVTTLGQTDIEIASGRTLTVDDALSVRQLTINGTLVRNGAGAAGDITATGDLNLRGSDLNMTGSTLAVGGTLNIENRTVTVDAGQANLQLGRLRLANGTINAQTITANTYGFSGGTVNANLSGGGGDSWIWFDNGLTVLNGTTNNTAANWILNGATVRVKPNGSNLSTTNWTTFYGGGPNLIESSGTLALNIGYSAGNVNWNWGQGGFSAYGGDLAVTLNGGAAITWSDNGSGFNGQQIYLGSAYSTHNVTLTNNINLNCEGNVNTPSLTTLATMSGNLTGGGMLVKQGAGTLLLTGDNSERTGWTRIHRGALDVGTNGAGLGSGWVWLYADNADNTNKGAVLQANGTLNMNIGWTESGAIGWDSNGGGFAARGGALTVNLEGGATLYWNNQDNGFRGTRLMFGSTTADNVVTLTNDIDAQSGYRYIHVYDNPNSTADKAVLSGAVTNLWGLEKRGDGELQMNGFATMGEHVRIYDGGTLRVIGDLRSGNAYTGTDPRYVGASDRDIYVGNGDGNYTGNKLIVTGNVSANYFNADNRPGSLVDISGNVATEYRFEMNAGTGHIGGNLQTGEHVYLRNATVMTVDGSLRAGVVQTQGNADRGVYLESGSRLSVGGSLQGWHVYTDGTAGTGYTVGGDVSAWRFELNKGTSSVGGSIMTTEHLYVQNGSQLTVGGNIATQGNIYVQNNGGGLLAVNVAGEEGKGIIQLGTSGNGSMYVENGTAENPNRLKGNGSITGSHIYFNNNAGLEGNWDITTSNLVQIAGNAYVAPGNSIGTITVDGNLQMDNNSTYNWELGNGVADLIVINDGRLTLQNGWKLVLDGYGFDNARLVDKLYLFQYTGTTDWTQTQFYAPIWSLGTTTDERWHTESLAFVQDATGIYITGLKVDPIPEPATMALLAVGAVLMVIRRRRRVD